VCALYTGRSLTDGRVVSSVFRTNEGDSYYLGKKRRLRESKQTAPAAVTLTSVRNKRDWIMAHFVSITVLV